MVYTVIGVTVCLLMAKTSDGGFNVDIGGIVAIVVALIGVIGTSVVEIVRSNKQGNVVTSVKADTSEVKPKVGYIEENTKEIRDEVAKRIIPSLMITSTATTSLSSKVDAMYNELDFQKRLRADLSTGIADKDRFMVGIEKLYQENARLNKENKDLRLDLRREQEKTLDLLQQVKDLNDESARREDEKY